MNYFNFNSQEILNSEHRTNILKVIDQCDFSLQNEIFGLFDGYYYYGIAERVFADTSISETNKLIMNCIFTHILSKTK